MDQAALDSHVNHLKTVINMEHKDERRAYDALVRGLCVAFQGVAPGDANVKALARRLQREKFDPEHQEAEGEKRTGDFQHQSSQQQRPASATQGSGTGAGQGTALGPGQNAQKQTGAGPASAKG